MKCLREITATAGMCGAQMQHDFAEKLAFTRGVREATDTDTIFSMLPGCISVRKTDTQQDKQGVDFVATLRRGTEVLIDSKTRTPGASRYWQSGPELALEIWSVLPGGKYAVQPGREKAGWTLNEASPADMILYTFDPADSSDAFLVGFQPLRMAFRAFFAEWRGKYKIDIQDSGSWQSECVFVPACVVLDGIKSASIWHLNEF